MTSNANNYMLNPSSSVDMISSRISEAGNEGKIQKEIPLLIEQKKDPPVTMHPRHSFGKYPRSDNVYKTKTSYKVNNLSKSSYGRNLSNLCPCSKVCRLKSLQAARPRGPVYKVCWQAAK